MKPLFDETRALALRLTSDARSGLQDRLRGAARVMGTAVDPVVLRDSGRKAVAVVRRNPMTTTAAVVTVLGAGVALWMLRRSRRNAWDERMHQDDDTIELKPRRTRTLARKTTKRVRASATQE